MAAKRIVPRWITVRNRQLSLWQTAVHEATRLLAETDPDLATLMRNAAGVHARTAVEGSSIPRPVPGDRRSLAYHVYQSKTHFEMVRSRQQMTVLPGIIRDYSTWNVVGWATCAAEYESYYYFQNKSPQYHDWTTTGQNQLQTYGVIEWSLPDDAKILLIGDWGTGMSDAVAMLTKAVEQFHPDAIIHLGDVYYSGTSSQCRDHVTSVIQNLRTSTGLALPFFTIPGNHEYYSGGGGFYEMIAEINTGVNDGQCIQEASYFCLRSSKWQFLAMDTGINDRDPYDDAGELGGSVHGPALMPTEIPWHYDKLASFQGSTILLSHHPLFSAFSEINAPNQPDPPYLNTHLYNTFVDYFGSIAAWYWGHEHNFAIYPPQMFLRTGRLLGCSSYEEAWRENPYDQKYPEVAYFNNSNEQLQKSPHTTAERSFYNHGFAVLSLGDNLTADYYQYPSWDQYDSGTPPELGSYFYRDGISPPTPGDPTMNRQFKKIMINGNPVSLVGGVSMTMYKDLVFVVYQLSSGQMNYLFGDPDGWYGALPLPAPRESPLPYVCTGVPAISVGPNNQLYVAFAQYPYDSQTGSNLCWGTNIPSESGTHFRMDAAHYLTVDSANVTSPWGPALAYDETNETLYAVYATPGEYNIGWSTYTAVNDGDDTEPQWSGNQVIPTIDGTAVITASQPAALVVEGTLYVAFRAKANNEIILCMYDINTRTWSVSPAAVVPTEGSSPSPITAQQSLSLSVLDGKIFVAYAGYFHSDDALCGIAFDPESETWSNPMLIGRGSSAQYFSSNVVGQVPFGDGILLGFYFSSAAGAMSPKCLYMGTLLATDS